MRRLNVIYLILNKMTGFSDFFLDTGSIALYFWNNFFIMYVFEIVNSFFEIRFTSYTNQTTNQTGGKTP